MATRIPRHGHRKDDAGLWSEQGATPAPPLDPRRTLEPAPSFGIDGSEYGAEPMVVPEPRPWWPRMCGAVLLLVLIALAYSVLWNWPAG